MSKMNDSISLVREINYPNGKISPFSCFGLQNRYFDFDLIRQMFAVQVDRKQFVLLARCDGVTDVQQITMMILLM